MQKDFWKKAKSILQSDGIIVAPTDTIFGILGKASSKESVDRIYTLKERDLDKPFIVLITRPESLKDFGIKNYERYFPYLKPKTSVVSPVQGNKWKYLHRGKESIAFRVVSTRNKNLHALIEAVGPLVAPSANPQGENPAKNISQAKQYFGDRVDFYIPGYPRNTKPSTIISLLTGKPEVLRK